MPQVWSCLLAVIVIAVPALGDGKFYYVREKIPPTIPYQRALLIFDKGRETLILQSKFHAVGDPQSSMGWVVPVPSVPELASMPADIADSFFFHLSLMTRPDVTPVLSEGLVYLLLAVASISMLGLVISWIPKLPRVLSWTRSYQPLFSRGVVYSVLIFVVSGLLLPSLGPAGVGEDVQVLKAEKVGIYDVNIITSDKPEALIDWLNTNGFHYGEPDKQTIEDYLKRDWCFVVAKVNPQADAQSSEVVTQGLVAPLILRFNAHQPVYPLALTANSGADTELLLYVLAAAKVACGDRVKLRFDGETNGVSRRLEEYNEVIDPVSFFPEDQKFPTYLCKFRGVLTPDQMREDLTFSWAEDERPYREHKLIWK